MALHNSRNEPLPSNSLPTSVPVATRAELSSATWIEDYHPIAALSPHPSTCQSGNRSWINPVQPTGNPGARTADKAVYHASHRSLWHGSELGTRRGPAIEIALSHCHFLTDRFATYLTERQQFLSCACRSQPNPGFTLPQDLSLRVHHC